MQQVREIKDYICTEAYKTQQVYIDGICSPEFDYNYQ